MRGERGRQALLFFLFSFFPLQPYTPKSFVVVLPDTTVVVLSFSQSAMMVLPLSLLHYLPKSLVAVLVLPDTTVVVLKAYLEKYRYKDSPLTLSTLAQEG